MSKKAARLIRRGQFKRLAHLAKNVIKVFFNGQIRAAIHNQKEADLRKTAMSASKCLISYWVEENVGSEPIFDAEIYKNEVDIIIPVYNGYEYLEKLFNSIQKTDVPFRLIVVNDKSTDGRVSSFLDTLKTDFSNILIINNSENLGFVKSVNKALRKAENHVVIINTDVEFPLNWLERLISPLYLYPKIASATPFTNSGSICSFPIINEDNDLLSGLSLDEIDEAFKKIKPIYHEALTGVGFCMAMNIDVVKKIGIFDEVFDKGYGEENDWCQRAIKAGYKNVIVENLFVWHKHGGSFGTEDKAMLLIQNKKRLIEKHSHYDADTQAFLKLNPHYEQRMYLLMQLLLKSNNKTICYFYHNLGGGVEHYTNRFINLKCTDNFLVLIKYDIYLKKYILTIRWQEIEYSAVIENIFDLNTIFASQKVDEIIVSSLVSYPDVLNTLKQILNLKKKADSKLTLLLHDYFPICPVFVLVDYESNNCSFSENKDCDACYKNHKNILPYIAIDTSVYFWRSKWNEFLNKCDSIIVFSDSSKSILEASFGSLKQIEVIPHQVDYIEAVNKKAKTTKTLNIGFLGNFNYYKGLNIINDMIIIIRKERKNIRLKLFGTTVHPIKDRFLEVTGSYNPKDLPKLTFEHDIDIFLIPSIWPETFSYTTQEVIEMDMPIACFDLGAPAERIKEYDKGLIISEMTARSAIDAIIGWYERRN